MIWICEFARILHESQAAGTVVWKEKERSSINGLLRDVKAKWFNTGVPKVRYMYPQWYIRTLQGVHWIIENNN